MASLVQNNNEHSLTSPEQKCTGEFGALAGDKSPSLPGTTNADFGKSRRLAQLCIFTAHVGKTSQQQQSTQLTQSFPTLCSKSHEETMVSHWLIDSNSSALSSQHLQTLRFFLAR